MGTPRAIAMGKKGQGGRKPSERHRSLAREVDRLLGAFSIEGATDEAVGKLAARIARLGRNAVRHLARSALRPGPDRREKVAAVLASLEGQAAEWARAELERLAERRYQNPTERLWIATVLRGLAEGDEDAAAEEAEAQDDDVLTSALADESQLLLWRDELASLPPSQQQALLEPMLQSGDVRFLPLFSALLGLRQRRLDLAIADALGRFASAETLPLVRDLLKHPDPQVRRRARQSLMALARQGVRVSEVFVATDACEPPTEAFVSSPDRDGAVIAVLVSGRPPEGFRCVVVLLDPIEAGVQGAWGESGLTKEELAERLAELFEQTGGDLRQVPVPAVQSIIAEAEDFARRQGHQLPADYLVWRRSIGQATEQWPSAVVFGPRCAECGARIRRGDIERGGFVAGTVALCALCAAQPRTCVVCGRPLSVLGGGFRVRHEPTGSLSFMCGACARKEGRDEP